MIYIDPVTETKEEGLAKLHKCLRTSRTIGYWKVKFLDGGDGDPAVNRFIKKKESGNDTGK